jgi:hypothetical protein
MTKPRQRRAREALERAGIERLYDLSSKRPEELLALPGIGPACMQVIRDFLDSHKLRLRGDEPAHSLTDSERQLLQALESFVEAHLPGPIERNGQRMRGVWVIGSGFAEYDVPNEDGLVSHPQGSPFVRVGVSDWEFAELACQSLWQIARLDEANWVVMWEGKWGAFRSINVYPDPALAITVG